MYLIETGFYTDAEHGPPWRELFESRDKHVFHYTKLDTALRYILATGRLRFGPYARTNDPRESKDWEFTWIEEDGTSISDFAGTHARLRDRANAVGKRLCRLLCVTQDQPDQNQTGPHFSRGYCHPRMWAQYAEGHTGVCLVLEKTALNAEINRTLSPLGKLFSGEVRYADRTKEDLEAFRLDLARIRTDGIEAVMQRKLEEFHNTYFFQKARDWQQEQEYRWMLLGDDKTPEFVDVDVFSSLRYLILGMDCAEAYFPSLAFFCEKRGIPIGRLLWRSGSPFFRGSITSESLKLFAALRQKGII
jgi:Protein of unknown function (DUF2971)